MLGTTGDLRGDGTTLLLVTLLRAGLHRGMPPRLLHPGGRCVDMVLLGNGGNWDGGKGKGLLGRLACPIAPWLSALVSCHHHWPWLNEQRCRLHPLSHWREGFKTGPSFGRKKPFLTCLLVDKRGYMLQPSPGHRTGPAAAFAPCKRQEVSPKSPPCIPSSAPQPAGCFLPIKDPSCISCTMGRCDGGEREGLSSYRFLFKPIQRPSVPPAQLRAGELGLGES